MSDTELARKPIVLLIFLLAALGAWGQAGVQPAWPERPGHVLVTLISERTSIAPGGVATVGVLLRIDPEWHVYWRNPGQSGLPTTIEWKLPGGWSAGTLHWPVPLRFETSGIVTYGYSGDVLLTAELVPPPGVAVGAAAMIGAHVSWLACRVECTPGAADAALSLPVREGESPVDARWSQVFARALASLPAADPALHFEARSSGAAIALTVGGWNGRGLAGVAFYPDPEGSIDDSAAQPASLSGDTLRIDLKRAANAGAQARLQGVIVLPRAGAAAGFEVDTPVLAAVRAGPGSGGMSAIVALLLALAGGLILNLMPCVLPVISIKVLSLVRNASEEGSGRLRHGLYFAAGVMVSFLAIGGVLVGLRSAGSLLGWGFQFQDPVVVALTAMLFFLIGLNLLGVFPLGPLMNRVAAAGSAGLGAGPVAGRRTRSPAARSFLSGLFAAAVATPCTAPFMGAALGYALSRPAPVALAVFASLAVGLSAPYVALSALPGLGARMPKPGRWMETLRQLLGFPMLAAVVWMLFIFSALAGAVSMVALVGALLAAGLGAWIWGRWGGTEASRAGRRAAGIAAVLIVAGAAAFAVVRAAGPEIGAEAGVPASASIGSPWEPWSAQRVAELRAQGRPVFIDFTARWCLSCQLNEEIALRNPAVLARFAAKGVATLRADWTDSDGRIAAALASYGRAGVPVYVLYLPGVGEPVLLPELLTPGIVLAALDRLG